MRQSMIFAPQDLLSDPPFSGLDLVTCRNLLIYLEPEAARRALFLLHSSLRTGGYLLLGRGEALPKSQEGFEGVSLLQNIYRKVGPISNVEVSFPTHIKTRRHLTAAAANAHRALVEHFEVPSALIDAGFQILRLYGDTGSILRLPEGEPTYDLLKLAPPGLSGQLRLAVADALAKEREVTMHGVGDPATGDLSMNIRVTPVEAEIGGPSRLLVSFIRARVNGDAATRSTPIADLSLVPDTREWHSAARLSHQELEASREELAALNEELKTSNEQLNASYEP